MHEICHSSKGVKWQKLKSIEKLLLNIFWIWFFCQTLSCCKNALAAVFDPSCLVQTAPCNQNGCQDNGISHCISSFASKHEWTNCISIYCKVSILVVHHIDFHSFEPLSRQKSALQEDSYMKSLASFSYIPSLSCRLFYLYHNKTHSITPGKWQTACFCPGFPCFRSHSSPSFFSAEDLNKDFGLPCGPRKWGHLVCEGRFLEPLRMRVCPKISGIPLQSCSFRMGLCSDGIVNHQSYSREGSGVLGFLEHKGIVNGNTWILLTP